jgi:PIN domain nuclease of toxin-antitoxin system
MKILLDTNVLTWLHQKPSKLGARTLARITEAHTVYYSPLSFFEWLQKDGPRGLNAQLLIDATRSLGFTELPLTGRAAQEATRFGPLRNRDPLDALILAQASHEEVDFYTSDQRILDLGLSFVKDSTH